MKNLMSEKLIQKLKADKAWLSTLNYIRDTFLFSALVKYVINWRYRSTRVDMQKWLADNRTLPGKVITELAPLKSIKDNDSKMRQCLAYVNKNITYKTDMIKWKVEEYWQTPIETWRYKTGDCEDGSILLYWIARYVGIPIEQLYLTAGYATDPYVGQFGHAYIVYVSEKDNLEYVMDWTFNFRTSFRMKTPYGWRQGYYYGKEEWFRINEQESFKRR